MKAIKNLQIKRPISLILAFGLISALSFFIINRVKVVANDESENVAVELDPRVFALPGELDTTWSQQGDGALDAPGGTCQYIYFGNYPQTKAEANPEWIGGQGPTDGAVGTSTDGYKYFCKNIGSNIEFGGGGCSIQNRNNYFRIGPIKLRILANEGDKLFLQSEKIIDAGKRFNRSNDANNINWSNCDLAQWTDGDTPADDYCSGCYAAGGFKSAAFTAGELGQLHTGALSETWHRQRTDDSGWGFHENNPSPLSLGPAQIFCLSLEPTRDWEGMPVDNPNDSELCMPGLGFCNNSVYFDETGTDSRKLQLTDYSASFDVWNEDSFGAYWSRSSFFNDSFADAWCVGPSGVLYSGGVGNDSFGVAPACKINLKSVIFASAARSAALIAGKNFQEINLPDQPDNYGEEAPGMYLRFESEDVHQPTVTADTITGTPGETVTIQGVTYGGENWSYSKTLTDAARGTTDTVSLEEVNAAGYEEDVFATEAELTSFAGIKIWAEKLGTSLGIITYSDPPKIIIPADSGLLLASTPILLPKNLPETENPIPNEPGSEATSPPTGDNIQMWLWLSGAAIGMISIGVVLFYRRTRKHGSRA